MNLLSTFAKFVPGSARWISLSIAIIAIIAGVYWKFGLWPAVAVAGGILGIVLMILLYNLALKAKERQEGLAFGKALKKSQMSASKEEVKSAVSALDAKWDEAMRNLKKSNIDLYKLPWFLLIGEPQSGKSTTLLKSGLRFPVGEESISGGGGTRNCDWWFTENGVILDTAGRFTFQEDHATDAHEWNHFLKLLAKYRPYCPVNGVILVIPVDALLKDDPATSQAKARNVRDKLDHIQKTMAIQFPVFLLLTKADTIYGFTEFFHKLEAENLREMLGWSNPEETAVFDMNVFSSSLDHIAARLSQVRKRNLSRPYYSHDSDRTFIFPEEFYAITNPLKAYMSVIFQDSVYKDPLFFRGYYFTSGLQEGIPIAKACGEMLAGGNQQDRLENVFKKSRAFFIRDFYTEKVFPERGLVRRAQRFEAKDKSKRRLIMITNAALLFMGLAFAALTYRNLNRELSEPKVAIEEALNTFENTPGHFFNSDQRPVIYQRLEGLQKATASGKGVNFLVALRGKDNDLTRALGDTFGYLYLDKVMTGLYEAVPAQLGEFKLNAPSESTQENLERLSGALAELKKWQDASSQGEAHDFKPSILPFLKLALDPAWDKEITLASDVASQQSLAAKFESWFQEIYSGSSRKFRTFLIEEMVRRNEGIWKDLYLKVVGFYDTQPELLLYKQKVEKTAALDQIYLRAQSAGFSSLEYQNILQEFQTTASEAKALFANKGDLYMAYPDIASKIADDLGDPFSKLKNAEYEPRRGDQRIFDRLPKIATFTQKMLVVEPESYVNPRGDGAVETLGLRPELDSFYTNITHPFFTRYVGYEGASYDSFPQADINLDQNVGQLFDVGKNRGRALKDVFNTNRQTHRKAVTEQTNIADLEAGLDGFYQEVSSKEADAFMEALSKVLDPAKLTMSPPSETEFRAISREFNRLTENGRRFDPFLEGPGYVKDVFDDHAEALAVIPVDVKELRKSIDDYDKEMYASLRDFGDALNALATADAKKVLASRNRTAVQFPVLRDIQKLGDLRVETPRILQPHLDSVRVWSTDVERAFGSWSPTPPDPCPSCRSQIAEIGRLARSMSGQFPISYNGVTQILKEERGLRELNISLADARQLENLLDKINAFSQIAPNQQEHLRKRGLIIEVEQAVSWANAVKELQANTLKARYQYIPQMNAANTILDHYSLSELQGLYKSRRMNLNSPTFRDIEPNDAASVESDDIVFHLFNDADGNASQSRLVLKGGAISLYGFILDGSKGDLKRQRYEKDMSFLLDTRDQPLKGRFIFAFDKSLSAPPDWSRFR